MKKKVPITPRNPFVALAKFRKAGSHRKPEKALRRQAAMAAAKCTRQGEDLREHIGGNALTKILSVHAHSY